MLTRNALVELYRTHRTTPILSVYLNAEEHDPAKRRAWRRSFDHVIEDARRSVDNGRHDAFDRALTHIRKELRQYDAFLPERGWAGFSSESTLLYAETMAVPMPDAATWEEGPHVAPYVRALKQARPVVAAIVDSQHARMFRYQDGQLTELPELRVDTLFGDLSDANTSKRATTHTGTRGETATDVAQRLYGVRSEQLARSVSDAIVAAAGDGFIVLGGSTGMIHMTASALPRAVSGRTHQDVSIHLDMSPAAVRRVIEEAASSMSARHQDALVAEIVDLARSGGRGCLGRQATDRALADRRVELLVISRDLALREPDYADECVGLAFEQSADVEEIGADAALRLRAEGEGIGAKLRFA
ncbi:MAG: hypothetical protein L0271_05445 [Gemmatimonadetes bacterium]|nr:hypothetical protein [Gemmatimonadota bacterium]